MDNFGNLPESGLPVPGVVQEKVKYTRYVYDDDVEALEEEEEYLPPVEKGSRRGTRKKKG